MRPLLVLCLVLSAAGTAAAGNPAKTDAKSARCTSALQCARACDAKHKPACDRLWRLLDERLENERGYTLNEPDLTIYATARSRLPKACGKRNRRACVLLGRLEEQGRGGAVDLVAATTRFRDACDAGDTAGCIALGTGYQKKTLPEATDAKAYEAFTRACKAKDQDGCFHQGILIADGIGTTQDLVTGLGMMQNACTAGSGEACRTLGHLYRAGIPGAIVADATRAREYSDRGCALGVVGACFDVAFNGGGEDDRITYYRKACELDDAEACSTGSGLTTDAKIRDSMRLRGCELGSTNACTGLAYSTKDKKVKARYLKLACDGGDDNACVTLALEALPPRWGGDPKSVYKPPTKKVLTRVLAELATLCDRNVVRACEELGNLYLAREIGAYDAEKARAAFTRGCGGATTVADCWPLEMVQTAVALDRDEKSCAGGDMAACARYGRATWHTTTPPPKDAVAAIEKACQAKNASACAWQERIANTGATALSQASCEAGNNEDCWYLVYRLDADGTTPEMIPTLRTLCDRDDIDACRELGWTWKSSTPPDLDGARAAFDKVCRSGATEACAEVEAVDRLRADQQQDAACERGDGAACVAVGERVRAATPASALTAFDRGCKGKHADACLRAARLRQAGGTGVATDPIRARDDLDKACVLGSAEACNDVAALWEQTGDKPHARDAWLRACESNQIAACTSAVGYLRDDKAEQKRYRAAVDRGCMLGDGALCDEARNGYKKPAVAASQSSSTSSSYAYEAGGHTPAPRRSLGMKLRLGGFQVGGDDAALFEDYLGGGLGVETAFGSSGALHWLGAARGAISYDQQSDFGHDAAAGLGVGYRLGPWRGAAIGWIGHDGMGASGEPMSFGVDGAWYGAWELRGSLVLGRWALGVAMSELSRADDVAERWWEISVDKARTNGKVIGIGLRQTEYDAASVLGGFVFWNR